MTQEERLFIKDQTTKELQRVLDLENADITELKKTNSIPTSIKRITDMTDTDLNDYLQTLQQSLSRILTAETDLRRKILLADKEKLRRQ